MSADQNQSASIPKTGQTTFTTDETNSIVPNILPASSLSPRLYADAVISPGANFNQIKYLGANYKKIIEPTTTPMDSHIPRRKQPSVWLVGGSPAKMANLRELSVDDALPPSPPPPEPAQSAPEPTLAQPAPVLPAHVLSGPVLPETIPPQPTYTDRGTGLLIFGIIQIILGLLAALMIPFAMLGAFMSRLVPGGAAMRPGQIVSGIVTYAVIAAALITLGVGSVQAKRWARALTLVTSWYGLAIGALVTILFTAVLPVGMRTVMAQAQQNSPDAASPGLSTAVMATIVTIIIVFAAFFLIAVPLGFVIFYGRKDVELTCRYRDPVERWTDRAPLPVLGASVVLFVGAFFMLATGVTTPVFPFFGRYLTGIAGAVCFLAFAALDLYLSVALFRLRIVGWWIAVSAAFVRIVSMALTYGRADLSQAYSKIGMSESEVRMLNSTPLFRSHVILWWGLLSGILLFGYLLWLKRYFKSPVEPRSATFPAQSH
jgi:hypothetical protein